MAWFSGKVSLGNFPDFSEAVNKLSQSVKNIEKKFDSALGIEEQSDANGSDSEASGLWPSTTDGKSLFEPIIGFIAQKGGESAVESMEESVSSEPTSPVREKQVENDANQVNEPIPHRDEPNEEIKTAEAVPRSGEELKVLQELNQNPLVM